MHYSPNSNEDYNTFWHILRIIGFCLSFANSCANPILLYCVSGAFRKHFNRYGNSLFSFLHSTTSVNHHASRKNWLTIMTLNWFILLCSSYHQVWLIYLLLPIYGKLLRLLYTFGWEEHLSFENQICILCTERWAKCSHNVYTQMCTIYAVLYVNGCTSSVCMVQ